MAGDATPPPRSHTIEIRGFEYVPERLEAAVGDTIIWINRDMVPHTATARDTAWNSGSMPTDSVWSLVVGREGRLDYFCDVHPTMTGTVVVRRGGRTRDGANE